MEAQPMNQPQETRKADDDWRAACQELTEALKCDKARKRLRNATTQVKAFTPPEGTKTAT